jgi:uncharacterized membrane protein YfcA
MVSLLNWELFFLLMATAFAAGFVKGGFGLGAGVLFTPFLSLFISPFTAIVLMSLILLLSDLDGIWRYKNEWNMQEVKGMLPWGLAGTCAGVALLPIVPDSILQLCIAIIALFVVIRQLHVLLRKRDIVPPVTTVTRLSSWIRPSIGASSGLIGYLSGTGGVILSMYFIKLSQRRERTATLLAMLTILDIIRVAIYSIMGYYSLENVFQCFMSIPFLFFGAMLGEKANSKLSDRAASYVFVGLLGVISVTLLVVH